MVRREGFPSSGQLGGTAGEYLPGYQRPEIAGLRANRAVEEASRALIEALAAAYDVTVIDETDPEAPDEVAVTVTPRDPQAAPITISIEPDFVFVQAGFGFATDYVDLGDNPPDYAEHCVEDFEELVAGIVGGGLTVWAERKMFTWWEHGELLLPSGYKTFERRSRHEKVRLVRELGPGLRRTWAPWPRRA